eukprot:217242-Chlamydomonas_euryale.AAC.1
MPILSPPPSPAKYKLRPWPGFGADGGRPSRPRLGFHTHGHQERARAEGEQQPRVARPGAVTFGRVSWVYGMCCRQRLLTGCVASARQACAACPACRRGREPLLSLCHPMCEVWPAWRRGRQPLLFLDFPVHSQRARARERIWCTVREPKPGSGSDAQSESQSQGADPVHGATLTLNPKPLQPAVPIGHALFCTCSPLPLQED